MCVLDERERERERECPSYIFVVAKREGEEVEQKNCNLFSCLTTFVNSLKIAMVVNWKSQFHSLSV